MDIKEEVADALSNELNKISAHNIAYKEIVERKLKYEFSNKIDAVCRNEAVRNKIEEKLLEKIQEAIDQCEFRLTEYHLRDIQSAYNRRIVELLQERAYELAKSDFDKLVKGL